MERTIRKLIAWAVLTTALTFGAPLSATAESGVGGVFTKDEIRIIATWYQDHDHGTGREAHGKKGGGLPPGIAKNLARGKPLPPGIAKQYLPDGLVSVLPPAPRGYERIIVDGKVLLVEIATRVIHDVLSDVVLR